jgi:hypothetical protein
MYMLYTHCISREVGSIFSVLVVIRRTTVKTARQEVDLIHKLDTKGQCYPALPLGTYRIGVGGCSLTLQGTHKLPYKNMV